MIKEDVDSLAKGEVQVMSGPLDERLMDVYRRLLARYGPQSWWPGDTAFEVIVGAILTQSAAWTGVARAIDNLKAAGMLSPAALRAVPIEELAVLIRPSVYFNAKSRKLRAFVEHLGERYDDDLDAMFRQDVEALRRELLSIHGIGEETADDILLYAADKPVFVIDAYTRRILGRLGYHAAGRSVRGVPGAFYGLPSAGRGPLQRVPRAAGPARRGGLPQAVAAV